MKSKQKENALNFPNILERQSETEALYLSVFHTPHTHETVKEAQKQREKTKRKKEREGEESENRK